MNEEQLKQKVQGWIVFISSLILIGKFAAYWLTNSVGILTDAMESIVNVLAGAVSLYSLRWSAQPKDKSHPFGHGKMEQISASVEGILITFAGVLIVYEGVLHLFFRQVSRSWISVFTLWLFRTSQLSDGMVQCTYRQAL